MAKKSGTRPPQRAARKASAAAKPAKGKAKSAAPAKATAKAASASKSSSTRRSGAGSAAAIAKPGTKLTKPTLAAAKPAKAIARTSKAVPVGKGDTSAAVSAPARPTKLATPSDRPSPRDPPNGTMAAPSSAPIEKPAPLGRLMLTQGPAPARPLTKKGTFALPKPGQSNNGTPKPIVKPIKRRDESPAPAPFVPVRVQQPATRTSEKAQKNKAGLNQKELDFFRDLLLAKRRELVGDMSSMEREALREAGGDLSSLPVHMADQGTDAYEQEFTLHLVEKDRGLLRELNDALAKIHNGTYGLCEGTGLPISKARLEAQPWARHSIEYARQLEKRHNPFRR